MSPEIQSHLKKDISMELVLTRCQLDPVIPHNQVFKALVSSVISQQLSGKVATVIMHRFFDLLEQADPLPAHVLQLSEESMRGAGLSGSKATYLRNIADFFVKEGNEINWQHLPDNEIITRLTKIKGVGEWTVHMLLIFTLGRPDVFPVKDLVIRQEMVLLYQLTEEKRALDRKLEDIAERWSPYRSYASRLLWKWKEVKGFNPLK